MCSHLKLFIYHRKRTCIYNYLMVLSLCSSVRHHWHRPFEHHLLGHFCSLSSFISGQNRLLVVNFKCFSRSLLPRWKTERKAQEQDESLIWTLAKRVVWTAASIFSSSFFFIFSPSRKTMENLCARLRRSAKWRQGSKLRTKVGPNSGRVAT